MPWSRIGRSTSTMPWSKSISMTRSAITHSRPMETCWYEEIVHSWPSTDFAPIETVPSWLRILQPCPTHAQRPSSSVARGPTSRLQPGPTKASPSRRRRERSRSLTRPSRITSRPYFRFSIPCRRMKRSSVRRPPPRGGGGPRSSSGRSDGGARIGSAAGSMAPKRICAATRIGAGVRHVHNCACNDQDRPHRRRSPQLPGERPHAARGRGLFGGRRGRGRPVRAPRGPGAPARRRAPRRAAPRHRRNRGRRPSYGQRIGPGDRPDLEPRPCGPRPGARALRCARFHSKSRALRRRAGGTPLTSLKRALWGLAGLGFVFGVIDVALILTSDHISLRGALASLGLVIGWGFIGVGLLTWARRPDNSLGSLMVATGFAWFVGGLSASNVPALFSVGGL